MKPEELAVLPKLELLRLRTAARIQLRRAEHGNPQSPDEQATVRAVRERLRAIGSRLHDLGALP
jgi:hypothetical protein